LNFEFLSLFDPCLNQIGFEVISNKGTQKKKRREDKKKTKGLGDPFQPNPKNGPRPGMTKTRTGTHPHPLPR
jgi:hypothetical protein